MGGWVGGFVSSYHFAQQLVHHCVSITLGRRPASFWEDGVDLLVGGWVDGCVGAWVGGWVNEWKGRGRRDGFHELLGFRGRWVGGWETLFFTSSRMMRWSLLSSPLWAYSRSASSKRAPGWVGGWVGGLDA